jgi:secreted PhoX family phosphatase
MRPLTLFSDVLQARASRREVLRWGAIGAGTALALQAIPALAKAGAEPQELKSGTALDFTSVPRGNTPHHAVAEGYQLQMIARWGDVLFPEETATFNPTELTAESQQKRFGYNNDFLAYLPFAKDSEDSTHGFLHVNHEYTCGYLMFPHLTWETATTEATEAQMQVEMEAHGFSLLELRRERANWQPVMGSEYTRRVTATTPIRVSGPAAGHPRLRTLKDPEGMLVKGTIANCSGGVTPWGTILVSEENIDGYFYGRTVGEEAVNHKRYTIGKENNYGWYRVDPRFSVAREPHEPNRFGWVVEYDPYNPESQPVKRTALGRFKHETATCTIAADGRVVVYSGDDDYFEYIYRFVSRDTLGSNNRDILDDGVLSVARFLPEGIVEWIPLVHGQNGLTAENGFESQADVLIEARRAGDVVGATKMDRPEGIAVHPHTQGVYVSLTKNPHRQETDAANPRKANRAGHILRMQPAGGDHGGDDFRWDIFVLAGDPESDEPRYGRRPAKTCPDNLAFDPAGRLWVCTDGMPENMNSADGVYAIPTEGEYQAAPRCFFRAPIGAEVTGPRFTPDGETFFLSVQHPAEDSSYDEPSTRWPDFDPALPPRPAVVAFTRKAGGKIGG